MAETLKFELVSPERLLVSKEVVQVVVPGADGEFAVMAGHAPVLSTLRPGVLAIDDGSGESERMFVRGGYAEVNADGLTVLAEMSIPLAELSADKLAQEVTFAEEDLADANDDETRALAQERLDHLKQLQIALHHA